MELGDWVGEAWKRISPLEMDREIVFDRTLLPVPPVDLTTSRLLIRRGRHSYGDYLVDALWCEAHPESFGHLALLVLATVFHDAHDEVTLTLEHPASDIRRVTIEAEHPARLAVYRLRVRPDHFEHWPAPVERHPTRFARTPPHELPWLSLTSTNRIPTDRDEERAKRDTVVGFGSLQATVELAALLLDLSRPDPGTDEVDLEGEAGFGGVAPGSAELKLILPGSFAWSRELDA